MNDDPNVPTRMPLDRRRLLDLVLFEYRSLVVRRLGITNEWGTLDWTDSAACAGRAEATPDRCERCPSGRSVSPPRSRPMIAPSGAAESTARREQIWAGMEATYREVRDVELLHLDLTALIATPAGRTPARPPRTGSDHDESASRPARGAFIQAVRALTRAALRRDHLEPCDFADFLAQVLAATAANVGGPDRLLAGRPGSWETDALACLLNGTMGDEPDRWLSYRTEPLVVPLNVAELVESGDWHPGLLGLDDATAAADHKQDSGVTDNVATPGDADIDEVTTRYTSEYRRYADRFAKAVQDAAAQIHHLTVEVVITADPDPLSAWWSDLTVHNPDSSLDGLIVQLWNAAHDTVDLPNVDISPGGPAPRRAAGEG